MFDSILKPEIILPIMLGINIWIGLDAKKDIAAVQKEQLGLLQGGHLILLVG